MQEGEQLAIAGETGCGKTTLLKLIAGFLQPDAGSVFLKDLKVLGPDEQLIAGHSSIAYLSQYFELRNNYYVRELMEMNQKVPLKKAESIYDLCRIAHLLDRKTAALSGGERQRIALARLLIGGPSLLLLDEPFSHLDAAQKEQIREVIRDLQSEFKMSVILVSHDASDLLSWPDRILIMRDGAIVKEGSPELLFFNPGDVYTAGILGPYSQISGTFAKSIGADLAGNETELYCVRPGQFQLTDDSAYPEVSIEQVHFFGNFYQLQARFDNESIQWVSPDNLFQERQKVRIRLCGKPKLFPLEN